MNMGIDKFNEWQSNDGTIWLLIEFPNMKFEFKPKLKMDESFVENAKKYIQSNDFDFYFVVDGKKIGSFKFILSVMSKVTPL